MHEVSTFLTGTLIDVVSQLWSNSAQTMPMTRADCEKMVFEKTIELAGRTDNQAYFTEK